MCKYDVTFSYTRYNKTHRKTVEFESTFRGIAMVKSQVNECYGQDYIDFCIEDIQPKVG